MPTIRLTKSEASVLLTAAQFLLAGEWDETISQKEYYRLRDASERLLIAIGTKQPPKQ